MTTPPPGLLLVDKPIGPTSHDVVGRGRYVLGTKKVGHAGTLDPMASGLLILGVERGTKLLGHLALQDKTYLATIRLGESTSTEDAEGEPIAEADASGVTRDQVLAAMAILTGDLLQRPSSVSAIKVDGVRAYARVRAGEDVELPARPVTVSAFELLDIRPAGNRLDLVVRVDCSTGTYVRALARDLGEALAVGAHLTALRRTSIGPFRVGDAVDIYGPDGPPAKRPPTPEGERPAKQPRPPVPEEFRRSVLDRIQPPAAVAGTAFVTHPVGPSEIEAIGFGRPIPAAGLTGTYAIVEHGTGRLIALAVDEGKRARPVLVWGPG